MLMTANAILNKVDEAEQFKLHPFVHSLSNVRSQETVLAPIMIPDVYPDLSSGIESGAEFSFAAGDFDEIYGGANARGQSARAIWRRQK